MESRGAPAVIPPIRADVESNEAVLPAMEVKYASSGRSGSNAYLSLADLALAQLTDGAAAEQNGHDGAEGGRDLQRPGQQKVAGRMATTFPQRALTLSTPLRAGLRPSRRCRVVAEPGRPVRPRQRLGSCPRPAGPAAADQVAGLGRRPPRGPGAAACPRSHETARDVGQGTDPRRPSPLSALALPGKAPAPSGNGALRRSAGDSRDLRGQTDPSPIPRATSVRAASPRTNEQTRTELSRSSEDQDVERFTTEPKSPGLGPGGAMVNHVSIGTEHILLGLIHEGEGVAAKALESLGI